MGVILAFSLFLSSVGTLLAGTTGTISGTVTSQKTGNPVAGVTVAAVSPSGTYRGKTDGKGFFSFTGVTPDTYTVSFDSSGFQASSVSGVNVYADQVADVSQKLSEQLSTIGRVSVRSPGGAYQPSQTQDTYTVTSQQIETTLGRADAISESNLLVSLPGASYDSSGYPVLRGGRENEEGFQFEGIDYTDAFTSQFINSLALNPSVGSLQLTPGAGDASVGNSGTGVINLIAKRGTYPGFGSIQATIQSPGYDHELALELGLATPNGRFSSYTAFQGSRTAGDVYGHNTAANLIGRYFSVTDQIGNDLVENMVFKLGHNLNQSIQLFAQIEQYNFLNTYGGYSTLNYKSNDPYFLANAAASGLTNGQIQGLLPLDPYQPSITSPLTRSPIGYYQPNSTYKLQYSNNIDSSTFFTIKGYRTDSVVTFDFPFNGQAFFGSDLFLKQGGQRSGVQADFTKQLGSKNLVQLGGKYEFLHPVFDLNYPYDGFVNQVFATGTIYDFVPNTAAACPLGVNMGCGYLNSQGLANPGPVPNSIDDSSTNRQDYSVYLQDTYSPSSKVKIQGGIRLDGSNYRYASTTNSSYFAPAAVGPNGFPLNAAGQEISSDTQQYVINIPNGAIHPLVPEPKLAISYQLGSNDAVRASYGRAVEFPSLGTVDAGINNNQNFAKFGSIAPSAAVCGVTGNLKCANYADQLYWTNQLFDFGVPYQPVLPATFSNFDFSYSHQFKGNVGLKITPFYRRGYNVTALVTNPRLGPNGQPLTDANGNVLFLPGAATNDGVERTDGIEFLLTKESPIGFSGQISATYINEVSNVIPNSANEDFFPTIPSQSLALGNLYRVGFLSPFQATAALQYKTKSGLRINPQIYYVRGYPIGQGLITATYVNGVPFNVANTNITNPNGAGSSTQYVDPQNPGSVLKPNVDATRGTAETAAAGGVIGNAAVFANMTLEFSPPNSRSTIGVQIFNLFGNVYSAFGGGNSLALNTRYQPVSTGVAGPLSGYNATTARFPSLGSAGYLGPAENGQQPYLVRPSYDGTQFQVYYNLKL